LIIIIANPVNRSEVVNARQGIFPYVNSDDFGIKQLGTYDDDSNCVIFSLIRANSWIYQLTP